MKDFILAFIFSGICTAIATLCTFLFLPWFIAAIGEAAGKIVTILVVTTILIASLPVSFSLLEWVREKIM